ncbi:MAG TPA: hypothetical protein VLC50_04115 [Actinomycetes bacterium]|nr:hypothetical protein [Actinomycetes bacterium]
MVSKARAIHPEDAQDERLATLPLSAAYTYAYLPTVLDDAGRGRDQTGVLNGRLWPLRADEHPSAAMEADLAALAQAGLVCRYTVAGQAFLHLPDWAERQQPLRPRPSAHPPCPTHDEPPVEATPFGRESFEESMADTFGKVAEQVNAFFGEAASNFDQDRIRDSVARLVEDVTFLVNAEKAASYGERVREFLARGWAGPPSAEDSARDVPPPPRQVPPGEAPSPDVPPGDTWRESTDDPTGE